MPVQGWRPVPAGSLTHTPRPQPRCPKLLPGLPCPRQASSPKQGRHAAEPSRCGKRRLGKSIRCNRQRAGRQAGSRQAGPGRCHERRWMEGDLITHFASSKATERCNYSGLSWRRGGTGGLDLLPAEQPQELGCPPEPGCSARRAPADIPTLSQHPNCPAQPRSTRTPSASHTHTGKTTSPAPPPPVHTGVGGRTPARPLPGHLGFPGPRPGADIPLLSQDMRPPQQGPPTSSGTRVCWAGEAAPRSSCMRSSSQSRNSRASCCALPRNCELCLETMFCKRRAGRALSLGPRCPALTNGWFVSTHHKNPSLLPACNSVCLCPASAETPRPPQGQQSSGDTGTGGQESSSVAHRHGALAFSCRDKAGRGQLAAGDGTGHTPTNPYGQAQPTGTHRRHPPRTLRRHRLGVTARGRQFPALGLLGR